MGYTYINELDDFVENHTKEIEWLSRERIENHNENKKVNIYNVLIWLSLVMLASEGYSDPEDIFSKESIEHLYHLKDTVMKKKVLHNH